MNGPIKKLVSIIAACAVAISLVPATFAATSPSNASSIVTRSPGGVYTTPNVLPRNINGNQAQDQNFNINVVSSDLGKTYTLRFSNFTNNMDSVNLVIRSSADNEMLFYAMGIPSGAIRELEIPYSTPVGSELLFFMSTNSASPGRCTITIR